MIFVIMRLPRISKEFNHLIIEMSRRLSGKVAFEALN